MNSKKQLNEIFGIDDAIAAGLAIAVPVAFRKIMGIIQTRNDYKKWLNKPEIMMMDELVKDDEWVKQVYNDIKNLRKKPSNKDWETDAADICIKEIRIISDLEMILEEVKTNILDKTPKFIIKFFKKIYKIKNRSKFTS